MNTKEKYDKKQKGSNGLQQSINMAWRCMKEIGDNFIKPYVTQKERIWDIQDSVERLNDAWIQYEVLEYEYGITALGHNLKM